MGRVFRSGAIEFDVESAMLRCPAGTQPLRRQVARTLELLMARAPALVTTDELLDIVWGRHAVSPSAVPQAIRELRRELGDEAQNPRYIETRHRLGYRWIEPVTIVERTESTAPGAHTPPAAPASAADADPHRSPTGRGSASPEAPEPPSALPTLAPSHAAASADGRRGPRIALAGWVVPLAASLATLLLVGLFAARPGPPAVPSDPIALAADPRWFAARDAFLEYRIEAAEQSLAELPDTAIATQALRARLAILRADGDAAANALAVARSRLDPRDRAGALWIGVLEAQASGREVEAWANLEPLLALRPDDADLLLFAWELRRKLPGERLRALSRQVEAIAGIPPARRALLAAQVAGVQQDAAMQRERARHALEAHGAGNPAIAALARVELAAAAEALRESAVAESLAREASEELEALGLQRAAIRASGEAVWNAMVQDRLDAAEAELARMQRLLDGRHDPAGIVSMRHQRALLYRRRGESARAVEAFAALAGEYEALGDLRSAANALNSSVAPRYLLGRGDEVPPVLERAIAMATRAQAHDTLGFLYGSLGNHHVRTGDLDLGHDQLLRALQAFRAATDRQAEATALGNLAEVAIMRGRLDDAVGYVEQALVLHRDLGSRSGIAYADLRLGRIHAARGDLARAVDAGSRAAKAFAELGNRKEEATARRHLGLLHLRRAEPDKAREEWRGLDAIDDEGALILAERERLAGAIAFHEGLFDQARRHAEAAAQHWRDAKQPIDARFADVEALRARLALRDRVAVEEEARSLLNQPEVAQSDALARGVGLVLAESLLSGPAHREASAVLDQIDATLARAPDVEDGLRVALLRARLDEDAGARRERRAWVLAEAEGHGLTLLALEAKGELAAEQGTASLDAWRKEAAGRASGLVRRGAPVVR